MAVKRERDDIASVVVATKKAQIDRFDLCTREEFISMVKDIIPAEIYNCRYTLDGPIDWSMWHDDFKATCARRIHADPECALLRQKFLVILLETCIYNIATHRTYIGNFEIQILLHVYILWSVRPALFHNARCSTDLLEGIKDGSDLQRYRLVFDEVLRRYKNKHTPIIGTFLAYASGQVIGLCPDDTARIMVIVIEKHGEFSSRVVLQNDLDVTDGIWQFLLDATDGTLVKELPWLNRRLTDKWFWKDHFTNVGTEGDPHFIGVRWFVAEDEEVLV